MTNPSAPADIYAALFALQAEPIVLTKNKDGQVGPQKTKYADLVQANAVILPRLSALGVLWLTSPTLRMIAGPNGQEDPRFVLDWTMRHMESGTSIAGVYPLPAGANPMQNGSAISYARRYALIAVTNTVADDEDDDGQGYRGRQGMAQRATVPRAQPPSQSTAQRGPSPAPGGGRSRPQQQPPAPEPVGRPEGAPMGPDGGPARGRGGLVTIPMTQRLAIVMQEALQTNDPDIRKQFITDMIGREVATSKDLTFDEGRTLIDAFEKAKTTASPAATVIDIYRRTTGGKPTGPAPTTSGRQPGQRSRNAAEAISNGGNEGTGTAPWEGQLPV